MHCLLPIFLLCHWPHPEADARWWAEPVVIQRMWRFTNAERQRVGRGTVVLDAYLCRAAQYHAEWMARKRRYRHSNLWHGAAEIIHHTPVTARKAVDDWILSKPHYAILLSGTRAGFGYAERNGRTYWVGLFTGRRSAD